MDSEPSLFDNLRAIAASSRFAHVITDRDYRLVFSNDAFEGLCGHPANEVLGSNPGALLQGPGTNHGVVDAVRTLLGQCAAFEFHIVNYHKNGQPYRVGVVVFPFRSDDRVFFLGIERPITEREDPLADPDFKASLREAAFAIEHHCGTILN